MLTLDNENEVLFAMYILNEQLATLGESPLKPLFEKWVAECEAYFANIDE